MLKATHQFKSAPFFDVCAWQYLKTNNVPVWVAQNFHNLGGDALTHRNGYKVQPTEWIVVAMEQRLVANVFTDEEFKQHFKTIPEKTNG